MRISVDKHDPGYNPTVFGSEVFLNGEILNNCITADDEKGIAIVYETDNAGNHVLEDYSIKTKELCGKISIVLPLGFRSSLR